MGEARPFNVEDEVFMGTMVTSIRDAWEAGVKGAMEAVKQLDIVPSDFQDQVEILDFQSKGAKVMVMQDLAERTGLPEPTVAGLIKQWAHTSNDDDYRALWLQKMAAEEFGVELSEWQAAKIDEMETLRNQYFESGEDLPGNLWTPEFGNTVGLLEKERAGRAFLRAMYDNTQTFLAEHGVEEVVLYRGADYEEPQVKGTRRTAVENVMESWSREFNSAAEFAGKELDGAIIRTVVPASRILATPFTGFGCLHEGEFVVLGGAGDGEVMMTDEGVNE